MIVSRRAGALALAATLFAGGARAGDAPVDLRFSFWLPPAHPLTVATMAWAQDIAKQSGGALTVTVYPSEQLGKAFDHYDMSRDGIVDIAYVNPGYQPGRFPVIAIGEIPFTFGDARKGTQALDSWYRAYAEKEMKDTHFCMAFIHDPGTLHAKRKVTAPDEIKGLKVRPAQGTVGQLVKQLGGTNVQASAPEAREVLDRGVADAITFPWGSMLLFGIDKVVKHHIDAPLYTTVFTYNINKDKYDALLPPQRAVLDAHCTTEWAVKLAGAWGDFEAAGREKLHADPSHHFYKLTPEELAAWKAAVKPLQDKWSEAAKKAGVDPDDARAKLLAAVAEAGAAP
jgi:TRAP-type C4-dicarboxylate transport system substrate-binding protein